ncbi:MAG: STAS/SEC14 domain-containing protein [Candidatus Woykebacteria bacterium]
MAYEIKEKEGYFLYKASGLYTVQDIEGLIQNFDKKMEKDPNAKFLLDYSEMTNFEQRALKTAYDRMEQGFPKGVKIAIVYNKGGYLYHILDMAAKSIAQNARFFGGSEEAEKWLLGTTS